MALDLDLIAGLLDDRADGPLLDYLSDQGASYEEAKSALDEAVTLYVAPWQRLMEECKEAGDECYRTWCWRNHHLSRMQNQAEWAMRGYRDRLRRQTMPETKSCWIMIVCDSPEAHCAVRELDGAGFERMDGDDCVFFRESGEGAIGIDDVLEMNGIDAKSMRRSKSRFPGWSDDPYVAGYEARKAGKPRHGNPYEGEQARLWNAGWDEAKKETAHTKHRRRGVKYDPYIAGYEAHGDGVPFYRNPYDGEDGELWAQGWKDADEHVDAPPQPRVYESGEDRLRRGRRGRTSFDKAFDHRMAQRMAEQGDYGALRDYVVEHSGLTYEQADKYVDLMSKHPDMHAGIAVHMLDPEGVARVADIIRRISQKVTFRIRQREGEWQVRRYVDGKFDEAGTYYTNDREDAERTMERMKEEEARKKSLETMGRGLTETEARPPVYVKNGKDEFDLSDVEPVLGIREWFDSLSKEQQAQVRQAAARAAQTGKLEAPAFVGRNGPQFSAIAQQLVNALEQRRHSPPNLPPPVPLQPPPGFEFDEEPEKPSKSENGQKLIELAKVVLEGQHTIVGLKDVADLLDYRGQKEVDRMVRDIPDAGRMREKLNDWLQRGWLTTVWPPNSQRHPDRAARRHRQRVRQGRAPKSFGADTVLQSPYEVDEPEEWSGPLSRSFAGRHLVRLACQALGEDCTLDDLDVIAEVIDGMSQDDVEDTMRRVQTPGDMLGLLDAWEQRGMLKSLRRIGV